MANESGNVRDGSLDWDVNLADRLLYLATPIILLVCGALFLLVVKPIPPPQTSFACRFPNEFSQHMIDYGRRQCESKNALLYLIPIESPDFVDDSPNSSYLVSRHSLFPKITEGQAEHVSLRLFTMAVLCLAPLVCWRMVGCCSGTEAMVTTTGHQACSCLQGCGVFIWFVITKVGAAVLSVVFLITLVSIGSEADLYSNSLIRSYQTREVNVLCLYSEKQFSNIRRFMVHCTITESPLSNMPGMEYTLSPLVKSLQIWTTFLLVALIFNALSIVVLLILCVFKSYRIHFIQRHMSGQQRDMYEVIDRSLGTSGVLVSALAVKNGNAHQVRHLLSQMNQSTCSQEFHELRAL